MEKHTTIGTGYVMLCIRTEYSSGLSRRESSLCVSRKFLARVCSFSISTAKLEGNHPHLRSRSLSPSYQPGEGRGKCSHNSILLLLGAGGGHYKPMGDPHTLALTGGWLIMRSWLIYKDTII